MVWGMSLPSNFGEFWPEGDFEGCNEQDISGWRERLIKYFNNQSSESQTALFNFTGDGSGNAAHFYPGYVGSKFISEIGAVVGAGRPPLSPIYKHEPPHSFDIIRGGKTLGSLIKLNDRILAADAALKTIIEDLEPCTHKFFPITINIRNKIPYKDKYYTLVIGQYIESFLPESSAATSFRTTANGHFRHEEAKHSMSELTFSKAIFGSAHLWRERRLSGEWLTCFSDELESRIVGAGLRIPKHYRMKEI